MELLHKNLTEQIINCFYKVYNTLGYGFLEKVYENAFTIELQKKGLEIKCQHPINVFYDNKVIGEYFADIVVNNMIILELKANATIKNEHEIQLMNYLKATEMEVGFVFNFGHEPEYSRKVFMNKFKHKQF